MIQPDRTMPYRTSFCAAAACAVLLSRPSSWHREVAEEADRLRRKEERRARDDDERKVGSGSNWVNAGERIDGWSQQTGRV